MTNANFNVKLIAVSYMQLVSHKPLCNYKWIMFKIYLYLVKIRSSFTMTDLIFVDKYDFQEIGDSSGQSDIQTDKQIDIYIYKVIASVYSCTYVCV